MLADHERQFYYVAMPQSLEKRERRLTFYKQVSRVGAWLTGASTIVTIPFTGGLISSTQGENTTAAVEKAATLELAGLSAIALSGTICISGLARSWYLQKKITDSHQNVLQELEQDPVFTKSYEDYEDLLKTYSREPEQ